MAKATHQCQLCMHIWPGFLFQFLLSPAVHGHKSKICEFDLELQGYASALFSWTGVFEKIGISLLKNQTRDDSPWNFLFSNRVLTEGREKVIQQT